MPPCGHEHAGLGGSPIRLIAKWLTAGVLEDGRVIETGEGTPQGAVISPLLANKPPSMHPEDRCMLRVRASDRKRRGHVN